MKEKLLFHRSRNMRQKISYSGGKIFIRVKTLIFFLYIILWTVTNTFAFQFEEFKWGASLDQVNHQVKNSGKKIFPSNLDRTITYTDTMLGEKCNVTLEFTPQTKLLASIRISWTDNSVGEDLKKVLIEKYGKFHQSNVFMNEYYWNGETQYDAIVLEYGYAGTNLSYFGGTYQQKYEEEFKNISEKAGKKF